MLLVDRRAASRRAFCQALASGFVGAGSFAMAQAPGRTYRVGVLAMGNPPAQGAKPDIFIEELARLGFVQGRNLIVELRYARGDAALLDALAADLVAGNPDVLLVASGTRGALVAKRATTTIPIVFGASNDPVASGLVHSLSNPKGNLTGNALFGRQLDFKRLQLLVEVLGNGLDIAVLDVAMTEETRKEFLNHSAAGGALHGSRLHFFTVGSAEDLPRTFDEIVRRGFGAVAINSSPLTAVKQDQIAALVGKHRLAAIADGPGYSEAGMLLTYSIDFGDLDRRAAVYVERILNGSKPSDLPVERASKFQFIVNLKTAKALGIRVHPSTLMRADMVIE